MLPISPYTLLVLTHLAVAPVDTVPLNDTTPPRVSDTLRSHPAGYSVQEHDGEGREYEYYSSALTAGTPERQLRQLDPKAVRVLFIGNSSTGTSNMPEMFHDLMVSSHHPCVVGMVTQGGADLSDLWNDSVPLHAIQDFPWDYVVIQERGTDDSVKFFDYARKFVQAIRAKHATPMLFTQYYQSADDQVVVDAQNAVAAKALGMTLIPISTAWDAALTADSSLQTDLFKRDGFHPAPPGAYLSALVMYRMITGHSPIGLPYQAGRKTMPDRIATILQHAAATKGPPAPRLVANAADSGPLLTVDALTKLGAFSTRFKHEPDSIVRTGRKDHPKQLSMSIGGQNFPLTMTDMVALAGKFPTVSADLTQAGLTAPQFEAYRLAFYNACFPLDWPLLDAELSSPKASVWRQNVTFLKTHPRELKTLQAAGMQCP